MNSLVNQAKTSRAEDDKADGDKSKDTFKKKINTGNKSTVKEKGHLGFVKVNMDGIPIGRKVDLNSHTCYETLAQTLEDMFFSTPTTVNAIGWSSFYAYGMISCEPIKHHLIMYHNRSVDYLVHFVCDFGIFL